MNRNKGKCAYCGKVGEGYIVERICLDTEINNKIGQYEQKSIPMGRCQTPRVFMIMIAQIIPIWLVGGKTGHYEFKRMPMGNYQIPKVFAIMIEAKEMDESKEVPSEVVKEVELPTENDFFSLQERVLEKVLSGDQI